MESRAVDAVGVWFYAVKTSRYLYLMRNDPKHPNAWGLPGGKLNDGETLLEGMQRECSEEIGFFPEAVKIVPVEKFTSPDNRFNYHTFICIINDEFTPVLNREHKGYAWINSDTNPKPLHPGLWATVNFEEIKKKIKFLETIHHNN